MRTRDALGTWIILHRSLELPYFPRSEAGPAAIINRRATLLSVVPGIARTIQNGESDAPITGARAGVPRGVTILSPIIPGLAECAQGLDWRLWEGGTLPRTCADVVIVCRPLEILRRMSLDQAATALLTAAFGGGAVYDIAAVRCMLAEHEARTLRPHRKRE